MTNHTIVLTLTLDCHEGEHLPKKYWAALEPYIHSTPMTFYVSWPATTPPREDEEINISVLPDCDAVWVKAIRHNMQKGKDGIRVTTHIHTTPSTKPTLRIIELLRLAEMGFRTHPDEGMCQLTDILKAAGLPSTFDEYDAANKAR